LKCSRSEKIPNQVNTRPFWSTDKSIAKYRWRWKIGVKNFNFFIEKSKIRKWHIIDLDKNRKIFSMECNCRNIGLLDNTYIVLYNNDLKEIHFFHIDYLKLGKPFISITVAGTSIIIKHLNKEISDEFDITLETKNVIPVCYNGILYMYKRAPAKIIAYDYKKNIIKDITGGLNEYLIDNLWFIDNYMFIQTRRTTLSWLDLKNEKEKEISILNKLEFSYDLGTLNQFYRKKFYFFFVGERGVIILSITSKRGIEVRKSHLLIERDDVQYSGWRIVSLFEKKGRPGKFPFYIIIEHVKKNNSDLFYIDDPEIYFKEKFALKKEELKSRHYLIESKNIITKGNFVFIKEGKKLKQFKHKLTIDDNYFENLVFPENFYTEINIKKLPFNDIYKKRLDSIIDTYIDEKGEDNGCIKEIKTKIGSIKYLDYLINPLITEIDSKLSTRGLLYVLFGVDTIKDDELVGFYYFFKKIGLEKESAIVQNIATKNLDESKSREIIKQIGKGQVGIEDFNHNYDNKLRELIHDKKICKNFKLNNIDTYVEILCFEHLTFYKPLIKLKKFIDYGKFEMELKTEFKKDRLKKDKDRNFLNQFLKIIFLNEIDDEFIEHGYEILLEILQQNHMHNEIYKTYEQYFTFFNAKNIEKKRIEKDLYDKKVDRGTINFSLKGMESMFQEFIEVTFK